MVFRSQKSDGKTGEGLVMVKSSRIHHFFIFVNPDLNILNLPPSGLDSIRSNPILNKTPAKRTGCSNQGPSVLGVSVLGVSGFA